MKKLISTFHICAIIKSLHILEAVREYWLYLFCICYDDIISAATSIATAEAILSRAR